MSDDFPHFVTWCKSVERCISDKGWSEDRVDTIVSRHYVALSDMHAKNTPSKTAATWLVLTEQTIATKENPMKRRKSGRGRRHIVHYNPIGMGAQDGAAGGFVQQHPWMTLIIALTALGTISAIATGRA